VDAASKKGILVVNSPEASSVAVAELVFGALLSLNRKIVHAHHSMKSGNGRETGSKEVKSMGKPLE